MSLSRAIPALIRPGLAAALALSLGACVSLLPQSKPAQLYRFGGAPAGAAAAQPATTATGPGVILLDVAFPREAAGDQILTYTGEQAAYIGVSRWVAPAQVLFQEAALRAFDRPGAGVRLLDRGDIGAAAALMRLDVRDFQADYDQGAAGAPEVAVSLQIFLTAPDGRVIDNRTISSRKRADANRVGSIVRAFDAASTEVLNATVDAVTQDVLALPPTSPGRTVSTTSTTIRRAP